MMLRIRSVLFILFSLCVLSGCSSSLSDGYTAYLRHMPKTVLVLPPLNQTADITASNAFISTVSRPLAECGYYVFPIAVVDRMMKENGVPTPGDMHQVPLHKLGEVFGADAVLYITIRDWTTRYLVISSTTEVEIQYVLRDVASGAELWRWEQTIKDSSGGSSGGGGLTGLIISATVHAVSNVASGKERQLAIKANNASFNSSRNGLLKGWRHPDFKEDQARYSQAG